MTIAVAFVPVGDRFELRPNPAFARKAPRYLDAVCHDRTAFVSIQCAACAGDLHLHESQADQIPPGYELGSRCPHCAHVMVFPPGFFAAAFQQLRDEGWLAPRGESSTTGAQDGT
jgi:hypothetical protein